LKDRVSGERNFGIWGVKVGTAVPIGKA